MKVKVGQVPVIKNPASCEVEYTDVRDLEVDGMTLEAMAVNVDLSLDKIYQLRLELDTTREALIRALKLCEAQQKEIELLKQEVFK